MSPSILCDHITNDDGVIRSLNLNIYVTIFTCDWLSFSVPEKMFALISSFELKFHPHQNITALFKSHCELSLKLISAVHII